MLNDTLYDTSAFGQVYNEDFFGGDGLERLQGWVEKNKGSLPLVAAGSRLGSPIARPSKIVCDPGFELYRSCP